ncbi:MAG: signal peptide peptidase SppA [Myxococcales bacterium]|nr:signal peptide peptidase SppA [Myxococcales bacterium]
MSEGSDQAPKVLAETPPANVQWVVSTPQPRRSWWRAVLLVVGGGFLGSTCSMCASVQGRGVGPFGPQGPRVGVVEVLGPITESRQVVEQLADFSHNDAIEAVVVRIDSPGGSVGPSQEIYEAIRRTAMVKPTVASMGAVAASGGYWIALGADEIFANPGTLTGSIGVIVQTPNLTKIAEILKFDMNTYKSGPLKDMGNPLRRPTPEDAQVFQTMVDDVFDQFVSLTADRRNMAKPDTLKVADGRIMTGRVAQQAGLLDGLGGLETAARRALALVQGDDMVRTSTSFISEESPVLIYPPTPVPTLLDIIGVRVAEVVLQGLLSRVEDSFPKMQTTPELQVR